MAVKVPERGVVVVESAKEIEQIADLVLSVSDHIPVWIVVDTTIDDD